MDKSIIRRAGWIDPPTSSRPVRTERWERRAFYAFPCTFLLDVPLDMTGLIHGARGAATQVGLDPLTSGDVLATDSVQRGAVLVEIEDDGRIGPDVVRIDAVELLVRELPDKQARLRVELDELVRWARELGHDVGAVYVRYDTSTRTARPIAVFAALRGDTDVEGASVDRAG